MVEIGYKGRKLKIYIYCRVSMRLGQTVENQIPIVENYAKLQGWDYEILTETESTRKTRPVLESIYQKMRTREIDGMACVRLDRALRSFADVVRIKELVDIGCHFYFVNQGFHFCKENNNAMASLQLNMLSAFAEFERELIRERTFEGLDRARAQGKKLGRPGGRPCKGEKRPVEKYKAAWAIGGKRRLAQEAKAKMEQEK
jgi:DNA invertase Pin-like site-specific DNA recombinase